jgi:hypothetical protein
MMVNKARRQEVVLAGVENFWTSMDHYTRVAAKWYQKNESHLGQRIPNSIVGKTIPEE